MKPKVYFSFSSLVFIMAGTVHLIRIFAKLPLALGTWQVPVWLSIVAVVITYTLGVTGLRLRD